MDLTGSRAKDKFSFNSEVTAFDDYQRPGMDHLVQAQEEVVL